MTEIANQAFHSIIAPEKATAVPTLPQIGVKTRLNTTPNIALVLSTRAVTT